MVDNQDPETEAAKLNSAIMNFIIWTALSTGYLSVYTKKYTD